MSTKTAMDKSLRLARILRYSGGLIGKSIFKEAWFIKKDYQNQQDIMDGKYGVYQNIMFDIFKFEEQIHGYIKLFQVQIKENLRTKTNNGYVI